MNRGVPELRRAGRSRSVCGRVAGHGGSAMVAQAWAPGCREKGAGLSVSIQVRAASFSNSSRNLLSETKVNHVRKRKCRMTHSGEGKDAMIIKPQGPNPGWHIPVHPAGAELSSDSKEQTGTCSQVHRNNQQPCSPHQAKTHNTDT